MEEDAGQGGIVLSGARVTCDFGTLMDKIGGGRFNDAVEKTAEQVAKDASKNIRSDSGTLAASAEVERTSDGVCSVRWSTVYARRVFYRSRRGSAHWAQQARKEKSKDWARMLAGSMTE